MNSLQIQAIPEREAIAAGSLAPFHVLVRVIPPEPEKQVERPPLNLSLVLDRSGSMSGGKLELAKEAACNLVSNLRAYDRVGVIAFDSEVTCVAPNALASDKRALHQAIRSIHTGGQTALHQGWVEGGIQVSQHLSPEAVNRIILLTDGQANVGETRPETLASHARSLAGRGVSTTTMGIGADYDEVLLDAMASAGDGNFYHIESSAQFEQFFAVELQGLCNLFGRNVSLALSTPPRISVRVLNRLEKMVVEPSASGLSGMVSRLFGRETPAQERVVLPNLIRGVPVDISLLLEFKEVSSEGRMSLLDLRLEWEDGKHAGQSSSASLVLPVVPVDALGRYPEAPEVHEQAVLMKIAELKHEANGMIRSDDLKGASKLLKRARALVMEAPQTAEMRAELSDLEYIQRFIDEGQYASASKHSYYQSHQRSHSRTSVSSGRDTRDSD